MMGKLSEIEIALYSNKTGVHLRRPKGLSDEKWDEYGDWLVHVINKAFVRIRVAQQLEELGQTIDHSDYI